MVDRAEQCDLPKSRIGRFLMVSLLAATSVIAGFLAYATTGSHRARAQSAVADGARNRTLRVHGINPTSVTARKPPFPDSRIMLFISISLSITKSPPEQRVDQDGMIQLHDRSSTSTSTKSSKAKPCTEVAGRPRSILETTLAAIR
jgi:hypothetical protein